MLGPDDKAILDFERGWWMQPGAKDQAIEFCLGLTSAAYYERLLDLVITRAAFEYDPLTIKRVRGIIESRAVGVLAV